jgi:hypothetical protein
LREKEREKKGQAQRLTKLKEKERTGAAIDEIERFGIIRRLSRF